MVKKGKKYTADEQIAYYKKKADQALEGIGDYRRVSRAAAYYNGPRSSGFRGYGDYDRSEPYSRRLGADLGEGVGMLLKMAGFGSYDVEKNVIWDQMKGQDPPQMVNGRGGDLVVRHREYICDVYSAATANTFLLQNFPIQPGLIQSFPWLASIAAQFEEWRAEGIVYEFKSMSADALNSTNTALGTVIMATEYNALNPSFVNKQQMENHEFSTSTKPSASAMHPIECKQSLNPLSKQYVRTGAVPTNADVRLYDLGNFQIATTGFQGTSVNCGELWCTYQIRFLKPQSTSALGQDVLSDHFQLNGIANATPLGTSAAPTNGSSIGGGITSGTTYKFPGVFQQGVYLFVYWMTGSGGVVVVPPTITFSNCNSLQLWSTDSISQPSASGTVSKFMMACIVNITGQNAAVNFGAGATLPTSPNSGDLFVTQLDSNIVS